MGIKGSTMVEAVYTPTSLEGKKKNNRFWDKKNQSWIIGKIVRCNGALNTIYENGVQKATNDEDFKAKVPVWARQWQGSRVVMVNKKEVEYTEVIDGVEYVRPILDPNPSKFYMAFRPLRADNVEFRYLDTNERLTEEEVKEYKSFITPKESSPIEWRTIGIDNIREIRMGGIRYQRGI